MMKSLAVLLIAVAAIILCGNASALTTYIPHITGGEPNWTDYLQVNNNAHSAASFTLALYNNGTQVYSQVLSIGGLSRSLIDLKALNPDAETAMITYTESGLVFRVSYQSSSGGLAEFRTIDGLGSDIGLYFSDFTALVQWKGLAIANMGSTPAEATLYALGKSSQGSGGSVLGSQTVTIPARDKIVGVHSTWFGTVPLSQVESIVAVTGAPSLCGIAICGDSTLSRLLFTPAIPVVNFITEGDCSSVVGNWAGTLVGNDVCGRPYTGSWTMTVASNCTATTNTTYSSGSPSTTSFVVTGNSYSNTISCTGCTGTPGTLNISFLFSGNTMTGNATGCGQVNNYSGSRQ